MDCHTSLATESAAAAAADVYDLRSSFAPIHSAQKEPLMLLALGLPMWDRAPGLGFAESKLCFGAELQREALPAYARYGGDHTGEPKDSGSSQNTGERTGLWWAAVYRFAHPTCHLLHDVAKRTGQQSERRRRPGQREHH